MESIKKPCYMHELKCEIIQKVKGTVKAEYNLPLKYCISIVITKKNSPTPPCGLKKVTALDLPLNSEQEGTHF